MASGVCVLLYFQKNRAGCFSYDQIDFCTGKHRVPYPDIFVGCFDMAIPEKMDIPHFGPCPALRYAELYRSKKTAWK